MNALSKSAGATLIEVLVTVLVLAVGLLGLSSTQVMSLKNGNNAHHRYLAALAAQEMAERIRANPAGLGLGSYNDKTVNGTDETAQSCSSGCDGAQIAVMDLYDWGQVISDNLPGGTGEIDRQGNVVTFTVKWKEQHTGEEAGTGDGLDDSEFVLVVEL
ncbi:type IV pilus modification protein PilV [Microbulbifer bruguierae]|uniref:Type IV pilus modification protein PilV n=1 Tax=Microbulbifer bruguierae TaxID=3029061 RepID=A0ABY8NGZ2_9GAMM|nr:type IV pilus modification protein PilV [Microbulbifer bruguierae]WGL18196.1 type IV pilus modification protein PilV [Microbulbifer bruguierae]